MATAVKAKLLHFRYIALGEHDRVVKGRISASSEVAAQGLLVDRGITPIRLAEVPSPFSLEGALPSIFAVKIREVLTFSRQLATLLEAGVSLLPALQLLETQTALSRPMRRIIHSLVSDLSAGTSFSQALAKHPKIFNEIFSRTIAVGERTGRLETVLRQMANHTEKQITFTKKIRSAMTYPLIVFTIGVLVSLVLLIVVLPPLTKMFTTMNVPLPLPTRILMALSNFIITFKLYLLAVTGVAVVGGLWFLRQPRGRLMLERFRLRLPIMGNIIHLGELARFARSMSVMLTAGLSLQEIMQLMPNTTSNSLFRDALHQIRRGLFLGQGLTQPMSQNPLFPPLLVQMVEVGEESNTLETNVKMLADFYEASAEEKTNAMIALIQPVSTIAIAGMAGFIALSVVMPIYSLTGSIK